MQWPVIELAEWEELRQCPDCGRHWLAAWPDEVEGGMILCSPEPASARRLRDIDRAATLRAYCLARLEEHLGELKRAQDRLPQGRLRAQAPRRLQLLHRAPDRRPLRPPPGQAVTAREVSPLRRRRQGQDRKGRGSPKRKSPEPASARGFGIIPGGDLLSHRVSPAVPSALEVLTSEFEMGSGVAPPV